MPTRSIWILWLVKKIILLWQKTKYLNSNKMLKILENITP